MNGIDASDSPKVSTEWKTGKYGWIHYDITHLVNKWILDNSTNKGILLVATNEEVAGCDMRFYSSEYSNAELRPKLVVEYKTNS